MKLALVIVSLLFSGLAQAEDDNQPQKEQTPTATATTSAVDQKSQEFWNSLFDAKKYEIALGCASDLKACEVYYNHLHEIYRSVDTRSLSDDDRRIANYFIFSQYLENDVLFYLKMAVESDQIPAKDKVEVNSRIQLVTAEKIKIEQNYDEYVKKNAEETKSKQVDLCIYGYGYCN